MISFLKKKKIRYQIRIKKKLLCNKKKFKKRTRQNMILSKNATFGGRSASAVLQIENH